MSWLQLRIICSREQSAAIERALEQLQALSITFEDNADQPIFEPELGETPLWDETRITGLFNAESPTEAIEAELKKRLRFDPAHMHWHVLEDKDWEREWMRHYHPIQCADKLWICPSWLDAPDPEAVNLKLDPGLAFGTGTHPTTFLCLSWLADQELENRYVIDYGCGSGILGIAALLLGAKKIQGVDIDPQALLSTQENVARNHLASENFPVCFPDKTPQIPADFVLANILAGPLVELSNSLIKLLKPGGSLCLSGVLASQQDAILSAYDPAISFDTIKEKDGWICLTGQKTLL